MKGSIFLSISCHIFLLLDINEKNTHDIFYIFIFISYVKYDKSKTQNHCNTILNVYVWVSYYCYYIWFNNFLVISDHIIYYDIYKIIVSKFFLSAKQILWWDLSRSMYVLLDFIILRMQLFLPIIYWSNIFHWYRSFYMKFMWKIYYIQSTFILSILWLV